MDLEKNWKWIVLGLGVFAVLAFILIKTGIAGQLFTTQAMFFGIFIVVIAGAFIFLRLIERSD